VPSGALAKRLLLGAGLGLVVLLIVGFIFGAVGSAMFGTDRFLDEPQIHLPPQPVFPASSRAEFLGIAEADGEGGSDGSSEEQHEEIHPLGIGEFAVTSTLMSSWFVTIILVLFFVLAVRKRNLVPGRLQGIVEMLFEGLLGFCTSVLGAEMARKAFPVVATIFFFVLFNAWLSLLPFYHFFGFKDAGGDVVVEFFRVPADGPHGPGSQNPDADAWSDDTQADGDARSDELAQLHELRGVIDNLHGRLQRIGSMPLYPPTMINWLTLLTITEYSPG